VPRDATTTLEAKWLGLQARTRTRRIVMPGGMKLTQFKAWKSEDLLPK